MVGTVFVDSTYARPQIAMPPRRVQCGETVVEVSLGFRLSRCPGWIARGLLRLLFRWVALEPMLEIHLLEPRRQPPPFDPYFRSAN